VTKRLMDIANEALRCLGRQRSTQRQDALAVLAEADLDDRSAAWR
jgi:hypothetical protein